MSTLKVIIINPFKLPWFSAGHKLPCITGIYMYVISASKFPEGQFSTSISPTVLSTMSYNSWVTY